MQEYVPDQTVVSRVNTLLQQAIQAGASDIHLEPTPHALRVRFRVDGILYDQSSLDQALTAQVIARIKVLARMDIAQKRIPLDGQFSVTHQDRPVDVRVSSFPGLFGEKIVIRILDRAAHMMSLDNLGLSDDMRVQLTSLLDRPSGFFLVTGPTGSGKTTTLYAALNHLNSSEKNIVTLEDPVEYNLEGITQGHINPAAGFTFEKGIRSLLRQDPDIMMVGEIRDAQTAHIAIEAALTGHVVLSTLHTNDAPSAIMRLVDMGIEPYLISAALSGVLAQRLARTICAECTRLVDDTSHYAQLRKRYAFDDATPLYMGAGCADCGDRGNKGRTGLFELLVSTPQLRALMVDNPSADALDQQACADGMITLASAGAQTVKHGCVSLDELARVLA